MSSVLEVFRDATFPEFQPSPTIADLAALFGPMPAWRIRTTPHPGTATEEDVTRIHDGQDRLCELVDGILVDKTVGFEDSALAGWIATLLNNFVRPKKLGPVLGPDGMFRLRAGRVRIPDVSFISADRLRNSERPHPPIAVVIPNLAVEVLSTSNTVEEMQLKLHDYFQAGVELVWHVDPRSRTVAVYTAPDQCEVLTGAQTLSGGSVLAGFSVELGELFLE